MSQNQLNTLIRASSGSVSRWVRGANVPAADALREISIKTGCNPAWLLLGEGPMLLSGAPSNVGGTEPAESPDVEPIDGAALRRRIELLEATVTTLANTINDLRNQLDEHRNRDPPSSHTEKAPQPSPQDNG